MEKLIIRVAFRHFKKHFKKFTAQKGSKYDFEIQNTSFQLRHPKHWAAKLEISIVGVDESGDITAPNKEYPEHFTGREFLGIKTRARRTYFSPPNKPPNISCRSWLRCFPWRIYCASSLNRCFALHCSNGSLSTCAMDSRISLCSSAL